MARFSQFSREELSSALVAGASLFSRSSLLVVLYAANQALDVSGTQSFVFAVGVVTALQVAVDPSALANFHLAARHHFDALRDHSFFAVSRLQEGMSTAVLCVPPLVMLAAGASWEWVGVSISLGAVAFGENALRFRRVEAQDRGDFGRFALVDVVIGILRCLSAVALLEFGIGVFAAFSVLIGVAEFGFARPKRPSGFDRRGPLRPRALISEAWPYSGASALSSIYSQGPVLILGVFGSVSAGATYAIAARFTQPLELLPAAISNVHMPALMRHVETIAYGRAVRRQVFFALAVAVPVVGALFLVGPTLLEAFGFGSSAAANTLRILSVVLIFKFVSFQLVAGAISRGRIRSRMKISVAVAASSVFGVVAVASIGSVAAALVTLVCEIGLTFALFALHVNEVSKLRVADPRVIGRSR